MSMKLALVVAAAWGAAPANAGQSVCLAVQEPVIDVHVHAYASDPRWTARVPSPSTGKPLNVIGEAAHRAATLDELRRAGIVRGIVSGDDAAQQRMIDSSNGRLVAGLAFDVPTEATIRRIRELHAAGRLAMIGEVGAQYAGIAPNDPRLEPLWAVAEELSVPVGYHIHPGPPGGAYLGNPALRQAIGDPLLLEEVLIRHPRLKIFVMHAGWPRGDEMVALLHAHPQIYVDVGVLDWATPRKEFYRYLERLVDLGFSKRILFGSDQMVWTDAIGQAVAAINEAPFLTAGQKRDILFNNAVRFFGWKDLEMCGG
jgi:predicted TIM-barrel fold metal-dependent hydrolase